MGLSNPERPSFLERVFTTKLAREQLVKGGIAAVGGLVAGLGMAGRVRGQEVLPSTDPSKPNPPFDMGDNEARVLSLDTSKETDNSSKASGGGETVENPLLPERSYKGKLGILKVTNSVNTANGELDVESSVTVTSQAALDKVEFLFTDKGLKGYSIDFNKFNYEETYKVLRPDSAPTIELGELQVCTNSKDARCGIPFINLLRKTEPGTKITSLTLDVLYPNTKLSQADINYLEGVLNKTIAEYVVEAVYGTHTALIPDPKTKLEAEKLRIDVREIAAFKFNFTPTE